MNPYIIGVDLGGTQVRAVLADASGQTFRRLATLTRAPEGRDAVLERILNLIRELAPPNSPEWERVEALGVAAPGPLDPVNGVVVSAPNLPGWKNVPLRRILSEALGKSVYVGNDANVAALAEQRFGAARGVHDLIYITVSTGIGGGVIADDRLLLGSEGLAGEIGHVAVEAHGPRCNCGNIGCLEALAAGPSIAHQAQEALRAGAQSLVLELVEHDIDKVTARLLDEAAQKGDAFAIEAFRQAGFYLGVGIVSLLHLFNSRTIVIGGSVAKAGPLLFDPMWEAIRARAMPAYLQRLSIVGAALGDDVGLLGAVALVVTQRGARGSS